MPGIFISDGEQLLRKLVDELNYKEFKYLKYDDYYKIFNDYILGNEEIQELLIAYNTSLYKLPDDLYLLADEENYQNLIIKDKGELWEFVKEVFSELADELENVLSKYGASGIKSEDIGVGKDYYFIIYPDTEEINEAKVVETNIAGWINVDTKDLYVVVYRYSNNAIRANVFSPCQLLSVIKHYIYSEYKET